MCSLKQWKTGMTNPLCRKCGEETRAKIGNYRGSAYYCRSCRSAAAQRDSLLSVPEENIKGHGRRTTAEPGSKQKIEIMRRRVEKNRPPMHPDDERIDGWYRPVVIRGDVDRMSLREEFPVSLDKIMEHMDG